MSRSIRLGALTGMAAAIAMAASPASAAELPRNLPAAPASTYAGDPAFGVFDAEADTAERHRRWRGWRGRGWRHRGWHRHRGVDAGDVLAGVLIIGGIAAIASAASNNRRDRDRDVVIVDRDRDYDRRDRRGDSRYRGGSGIDNAVSQCVNEIERDVRVDEVDSVDRTGGGWNVSGTIYNGDRFTCRIGNDGRIDGIDFGGGFSGASTGDVPADGQWTDAEYYEARQTMRAPAPATAQPAYPGGPLPGENADEYNANLGG